MQTSIYLNTDETITKLWVLSMLPDKISLASLLTCPRPYLGISWGGLHLLSGWCLQTAIGMTSSFSGAENFARGALAGFLGLLIHFWIPLGKRISSAPADGKLNNSRVGICQRELAAIWELKLPAEENSLNPNWSVPVSMVRMILLIHPLFPL